MISKGYTSASLQDILTKVNEGQILNYYFGITQVPFRMKSPLRKDDKPSFGIYSSDGKHIHYKDFATGEQGSLFDLLMKIYNISFPQLLNKLCSDMNINTQQINIQKSNLKHNITISNNSQIRLEVKVRDWRNYDVEYWESYGCNVNLVKYTEVYPISHKIIYKDNKRYVFACDKYAYCFVERKEGNITKKIYQPYNKNGYKWTNSNDKSVIGLWSKLPETADVLLICSSLKDALCLWSNVQIPCVYVQSETTGLSDTALQILRKRFNHIYIAFDGDNAGIKDANNLSLKTGLSILKCPKIDQAKDWSDIYHFFGKKRLIKEFKDSYSSLLQEIDNDLPFF